MNEARKTAKIYLGRHCKTEWNLEGRLIGTTDLPPSEFIQLEKQLLFERYKQKYLES